MQKIDVENVDVQRLVSYLEMRSQSERRDREIHDYLTTLDEFCEVVKRSPSEILDAQDEDDKRSRRERLDPIRRYLITYLDYLKTKGLAHNTIATRAAHLMTFLKSTQQSNKYGMHP
jgi:hypothetical protein